MIVSLGGCRRLMGHQLSSHHCSRLVRLFRPTMMWFSGSALKTSEVTFSSYLGEACIGWTCSDRLVLRRLHLSNFRLLYISIGMGFAIVQGCDDRHSQVFTISNFDGF
ncbi:hypothetical protein NPIL_117641 [Nephila pilipes]|uniref:Uncharacterized protein n=1 Tax=Nephila pilipes TaxID=299642 RepID=A0A8X6QV64_NEPPI|nr:hypothetical protein NPIL_117641 [Nephila pilipes]